MNQNHPACKQVHPYFVLCLDKSFDMEPDELRTFLQGIPNLYYIECEGTIYEHGQYRDIDCMLLWFYNPEYSFSDSDYTVSILVEWLSRYGLDISEDYIFVDYESEEFAPSCCCNAPLFEFPKGYRIESITSNISCPDDYLHLLRHCYVRNVEVFAEYERTHPETCTEEEY
ncbi:MAG: hypothetical protein J6S14_17635 [Clostridia bacterium]|nr:hypothetical protein [Clostridia bacterium]